MTIFYGRFFSLSMRVPKPTELLETFVVCTEKALFLKELHRDGLHASRRADWASWALRILADGLI
ncbi:hypothetical protein T4D_10257 [Trichinella pseudospiralis]|uniref:Uncharacterized protein n=1 Tax=Trichinella pseudospiralis TaxID=6337 RepID=A0A0V1FKF1_TRIPS|nr:hypothetical protein T4D_10257 [Trichinella pseudospiralis]